MVVTAMPQKIQSCSTDPKSIFIDPDFADILPRFVATREALLCELRGTVLARDFIQVRRICHKLKGSFGLYGFLVAADLCDRLMNQWRISLG